MSGLDHKQSDITLVDSQISCPEKATLTTVRLTSSAEDCCDNSALTTPTNERCGNPFDVDIEARASNSSVEKPCRKSLAIEQTDCQVWPGKDHWKKQAKQAKMNRSCSCLARLSRRNRIICKVGLILLVVGVAVAVGFGVSKPLGAPIWGGKKSDDS
ncbi:hypothetical protein ESCO_005857 [Escovopsis weberi]|uniref:Uncharacterized protein n=1 Tax=Escovopsis weberi TaxID=150374 RepID=A0A0M8MRQ7_ESCWE|nr:hypothetical protein ESCO_005857 [Escovopsis weberi]